MTDTNDYAAPWRLHFDRDGTEDFGIVCDAEGRDLAASHVPCTRIGDRTFDTGTFWLPEPGDATPQLLRKLTLMTAAPQLLSACKLALAAMEQALEAEDPQARTQIEWEAEPLATLRAAIELATDTDRYR